MRIFAFSLLAILLLVGVAYYFYDPETPFQNPASTSSLPMADQVIVGTLDEPIPEQEKIRQGFLWHHFANKPEEKQFSDYDTKNRKKNFDDFSEVLIKKAEEKNLDAASLRKALKKVRSDAGWWLAYLPIGAYQTTLEGNPVWIIVVKWENSKGGSMGHIRMFAFDQATLKQVAFCTCM